MIGLKSLRHSWRLIVCCKILVITLTISYTEKAVVFSERTGSKFGCAAKEASFIKITVWCRSVHCISVYLMLGLRLVEKLHVVSTPGTPYPYWCTEVMSVDTIKVFLSIQEYILQLMNASSIKVD